MIDVSTTSAPWKPRRLKVPREDRRVLAVPTLPETAVDAASNHDLLTSGRVSLQGRPLEALRRWSRDACLLQAAEYTSSLMGRPVPVPESDDRLLFVAGHQPSLYHPGVWIKNFAIDRLAKQTGGIGLNLIVDNDTIGSTSLRVPTGSRSEPSLQRVPFDESRAVQPWEDASIADPDLFATFADRVCDAMQSWDIRPLLTDIWPDAVGHQQVSSRLCDCLSAARHRQERRWDLQNLELPISRMCETEPFLWFASHILAQLPTFQEVHNRVLSEYRRLNRVRSRNHPVPELADSDGWLEAPFWIWKTGEARRRGVLAKQVDRQVWLSDGEETFAKLPLAPDMDACCAVEVLKELPARGLRFRTRALTTTLFSRLCLGDLFVHGIGGAKYDEMTDQIIREFYRLEPPKFLTMSATLHLPLAEPFATTAEDRRRAEYRLRDLTFNADRHDLGDAGADLVRQKQQLIAAHEAAQTEGLTRRQRQGRRPANRARHQQLKYVNARLASLATEHQQAARDELARIDRELAANDVLQSREFSFALFPADMLREFLSAG